MRPSPLRHPLAILRTLIGLTQSEMAKRIHRSPPTIQAIELGKLPLSEGLAINIAQETAVDELWLLAGDPLVPPRKGMASLIGNAGPGPYTREVFERHRAWKESPAGRRSDLNFISDPNDPESVLFCDAKANKKFDAGLGKWLKQLLEETRLTDNNQIVRLKIRRLIEELADANKIVLEAKLFGAEAAQKVK